jgi:hypothetical protein
MCRVAAPYGGTLGGVALLRLMAGRSVRSGWSCVAAPYGGTRVGRPPPRALTGVVREGVGGVRSVGVGRSRHVGFAACGCSLPTC